MEYSNLAFSTTESYLVSSSGIPDFAVTVWDWSTETAVAKYQVGAFSAKAQCHDAGCANSVKAARVVTVIKLIISNRLESILPFLAYHPGLIKVHRDAARVGVEVIP